MPEQPVSKATPLNVNELYGQLGLPPTHKQYKRSRRTLSLSDQAYEGLIALAAEHNLNTHNGGNVSALLECIGLGLFSIEQKEAWQLSEEGLL